MGFINWAHVLGIYLPALWIVALLYLGFQIVPVFFNNPALVDVWDICLLCISCSEDMLYIINVLGDNFSVFGLYFYRQSICPGGI